MAKPRGLSDEEVKALEAPVKGMTDEEVEAQSVDNNTGVPGSPLEKALKAQTGDVVTVETPTGPAKFTRSGARFYDGEDAQQMFDAGGARLKERALETGLSLLSGGGPLLDEGAGYMAGVDRDDPSGLKAYQRSRDSARRDVARATRHASPAVEMFGQKVPVLPLIGAAIPSLMAPNPAGVMGRIAATGAVGAEQAAGESEADLTKGEVTPFLRDTGAGLGTGLVAGGVSEAVTAPMRLITRGAASRIGDAAAGQAARDVAQVEREVGHLQGVARAETQKGSRYTENVLRKANGLQVDPSTVTDPTQRRAISMLDEQAFKDLADSVANNTMDDVPRQVSRIADAKRAASSAAATAAQDASDRTRDYFRQSTWGTQIQPRLTTLAENAALGGVAGGVTGGASGLFRGGLDQFADGVISGIGGSALSGGSGLKTLAKNAMQSPLVQTSALQKLIQASQLAQKATQKGARSATAVGESEENAIQAFLQSP